MFNTTPLAYKYVMTALMIAFINHIGPQLNMRFGVPLDDQQRQRVSVAQPILIKTASLYGAGYKENNYALDFTERHIRYSDDFGGFSLTKLEDDGMTSFGIPLLKPHEPSNSLMERASLMKYTITNTNDLYRVATNYLAALEIDVKTLEKNGPLTLNKYADFHSSRGVVPNPLVYAMWGNPELRNPGPKGVAMEISAVSGELLELNAGISVGKNFPLIKDLDKLLAISDADFLKYTDVERSNLVVRFAAMPYPALANSWPSTSGTNDSNQSHK